MRVLIFVFVIPNEDSWFSKRTDSRLQLHAFLLEELGAYNSLSRPSSQPLLLRVLLRFCFQVDLAIINLTTWTE